MIIPCPRDGCGRRRNSPCSSTCALSSAIHLAEIAREAERAAAKRALAQQKNEELMRLAAARDDA